MHVCTVTVQTSCQKTLDPKPQPTSFELLGMQGVTNHRAIRIPAKLEKKTYGDTSLNRRPQVLKPEDIP